MAESKPILGYWNIRGMVQPIKYMLEYLGVPYKEVQYDISNFDSWFSVKESLGLEFPNVPYWIDGDVKLTEAKAILKYLARKHDAKLVPGGDALGIAKVEMIESLLFDMWNGIFQYVYFNTEQIIEYFPKNMANKLQKLSDFVGNNEFCLGELSYLDFILSEVLVVLTRVDGKLTEPHDNLRALRKNVESIPQIAKYIESPQYIDKPCFGPMAKVQV